MPATIISTSSDGTILWSDGTVTRPNYPEEGQDTFDTLGTFDPVDSTPNVNILVPGNSLTTGEIIKNGNGTSGIFIFSDAMKSLGVSLFALNPGSAKIQFTYDQVATIQNGNDASINWFDWSKGTVVASTSSLETCPRAMRLYVISGNWRLDWKAMKT